MYVKKKKQNIIIDDTQGNREIVNKELNKQRNINGPFINKQKDKDTFTPIEPKQPTEPKDTNKSKIKNTTDPFYKYKNDPNFKPEISKQEQNEFSLRPGGVDPYYSVGVNYKPREEKIKELDKQVNLSYDRPGTIDPYYSQLNKPTDKINVDPLLKALEGPKISDSEGLQRAYQTDSNIYIYGDTMFISGTKGTPFISKDWQQNYKYIGIPFVKQQITDGFEKILGGISFLTGQPELAPVFGAVGKLAKNSMGENTKEEMKIKVYETDRYKEALRVLQDNPQIQKVVGHSLGGSVALELKKTYPNLTGRVYSTPYWDPYGKEFIKGVLDRDRMYRDQRLTQWYEIPEKMENDAIQTLTEKLTGLDNTKSIEDQGIERYRILGDPIASGDNSAQTSVISIGDALKYNSLFHNYQEISKNNMTSDSTQAYGKVNQDNTISLRE